MEVIGSKMLYIGPTVPTEGVIDSIWLQNTSGAVYRCTSISPLTYELVSGGLASVVWTDVPFDAGDFTAKGAMTWTVDAGDVLSFKYALIGKLMHVIVSLINTTIGGVLDSELYIKIPAGKTGLALTIEPFIISQTANEVGYLACDAGVDKIRLMRLAANWIASANSTHIFVNFSFPIN